MEIKVGSVYAANKDIDGYISKGNRIIVQKIDEDTGYIIFSRILDTGRISKREGTYSNKADFENDFKSVEEAALSVKDIINREVSLLTR